MIDKLDSFDLSLDGETKSIADSILKDEYSNMSKKIKDNLTIKYLDKLNEKLKSLKADLNLGPVIDSINEVQDELDSFKSEIEKTIADYGNTQLQESSQSESQRQELETLKQSILSLKKEIYSEITLLREKKIDFPEMPDFAEEISVIENRIEELATGIDTRFNDQPKNNYTEEINSLRQLIQKLEKDLTGRLASIQGGGSMNRQITVGNVDPLTKYTDINFKAGSNVTITSANNNTTKRVDITIASSGGGGGSTRSISSVSTNTAAGSTAGTDYVYLCSGTMTLTLPDAVANTNLYTVKNVGTGVITIATTSAQTIDGDTTVIMPVRYTAVDLISDTANWNVT